MIKHILTALLPITLSAAAAAAEPSNWYLGLGVGGSFVDLDDAESDLRSAGLLIREISDSGGASRMYLGYAFNPVIAVETGLVGFGEFELETRIPDDTEMGHRQEWEGSAWYLDAVAGLNLATSWRLIGRLGIAHSRVESQTYSVIGREPFRDPTITENSTGVKLGLGFEYSFIHWSVRLDMENYRNVVDVNSSGQANLELATLSAHFRF
jgi:opacity protein-like surface antigen